MFEEWGFTEAMPVYFDDPSGDCTWKSMYNGEQMSGGSCSTITEIGQEFILLMNDADPSGNYDASLVYMGEDEVGQGAIASWIFNGEDRGMGTGYMWMMYDDGSVSGGTAGPGGEPTSEFSFDMDAFKINNSQYIDEETGDVYQMSTVEMEDGYIS